MHAVIHRSYLLATSVFKDVTVVIYIIHQCSHEIEVYIYAYIFSVVYKIPI